MTGAHPWLDWWALREVITWIPWPSSASLFGVALRVQTGRPFGVAIAQMSAVGWGVIAMASVFLAWAGRKARDRFAASLLVSLLVQPLGWLMYSLWLVPALIRRETWPWSLRAAIALACVPLLSLAPLFLGSYVQLITVGSLWTVAAGLALWAIVTDGTVLESRTR